jgi:hypothetical protein
VTVDARGAVPGLARAVAWPGRGYRRRWADALLDAIEERSLHALVGIWLAMIAGCALVYWIGGLSTTHHLSADGVPVPVDLHGLATALYFSFVTATSVGYGDVVPRGALRALAVVEAAAGLLAFGVVVSRFVSRRQDELVREIHRTTFEERLDRVQTNLHLVLSELQTIAALCDAPTTRPERLGARLESAAMVFAGELRAVHALLYRPEHAPEETVLQAILASLAAALSAFVEVLGCVPEAIRNSQALHDTRRTMARLAEEICGECVPRVYAPGMKQWMDRVRETARAIA